MDINKELKGHETERLVGKLAEAYTLLAQAPYDNWGHEGSPGEMAAYVVKVAADRGSLGFVKRTILGDPLRRGW